MHMCYERPGLVTALNGAVGYDKWDRDRDRGGGGGGGAAGGGGGAPGGAWAGRDRERDRERERQARAHQMSHAHQSEPDAAAALFQPPLRVTGNRDRQSQQIQAKLGDYQIAQALIDEPSKSIGICAEPPSPAPCHPSRRESEFKKPSHAPQNGRVHHRPYSHTKSDGPSSTVATSHRPPPLKIPNGVQSQSAIDSCHPPVESILKEMKSLPQPLSVIAATPRKELENKFIFNPYTNKVQENPQLTNNDLKTPLPKPGLDNRISHSRSVTPPDVVNKDLGLSESDDEAAATNTRLEPILSPIGSGGSPSSASESSDTESESSSAESSGPAPAPAPAPQPPAQQRASWSLSNFAPPPAQPPEQFDDGKELRHALADVKGKPSPISDLSDSEASSPSPDATARRRRSVAKRSSAVSSDEESSRPQNTGVKRGRPAKPRAEERPAKKKRGRPPKARVASPPPDRPGPESDPPLMDTKTHIFRKVFTPKNESGGKGGKGGKGKGGKGKGQVTIIEVAAESADDDERRHRERSNERRSEEAIARVSPPPEPEPPARRRDAERLPERIPDRADHRRSDDRTDRPATERTSNDRIPSDRTADRLAADRLPADRYRSTPNRHSRDRISSERSSERSEKTSLDRLSGEKIGRLSADDNPADRPSDRTADRLAGEKLADRLERIVPDRYIKAEADVGSGVKGRGSERLEEASSNVVGRAGAMSAVSAAVATGAAARCRLVVRVPLARLRAATVRALAAPPPRRHKPRVDTPPDHQAGEVAATNHERTASAAGRTPIYYSYFERLPADALSDEERDHKYYLCEAKRLKTAAECEQEPLSRVMLYLESVLCFVLTGRVLELELDTKRAFTIYRETIEYIKSIHSMPQRFRASPHSTFNKLDILSLRVQALLYLRMFKMYNREVKEYNKIVQEYQQKPACPESVSPLSPTPSPGGSVGSVGSAASASSGYCSLAHSVPAQAHNALLQLTKYYTFLYVAHDLWEQADNLCRLRANQDLFIAVDRKCGPLTLFSTFRHLVQYVRHAISLLKK